MSRAATAYILISVCVLSFSTLLYLAEKATQEIDTPRVGSKLAAIQRTVAGKPTDRSTHNKRYAPSASRRATPTASNRNASTGSGIGSSETPPAPRPPAPHLPPAQPDLNTPLNRYVNADGAANFAAVYFALSAPPPIDPNNRYFTITKSVYLSHYNSASRSFPLRTDHMSTQPWTLDGIYSFYDATHAFKLKATNTQVFSNYTITDEAAVRILEAEPPVNRIRQAKIYLFANDIDSVTQTIHAEIVKVQIADQD